MSVCWNLRNNELYILYFPAVCKQIAFPLRYCMWQLNLPQIILSEEAIFQFQSNVGCDQHSILFTQPCCFLLPVSGQFPDRTADSVMTHAPLHYHYACEISSNLWGQGGASSKPRNLPALFHGTFLWKAVNPENCQSLWRIWVCSNAVWLVSHSFN